MSISKEDYLRAKELIKEYEKENKKRIGVICLNRFDYLDYIRELNNVDIDIHKFHKISKVDDLCSLTLDDYVVTQLGDQNNEFEQIIKLIKINLSPKNK